MGNMNGEHTSNSDTVFSGTLSSGEGSSYFLLFWTRVFQVMDAESGELFLGGDVAADSWQLDAPFSCPELLFSGSEKPLQDWAVDPDSVSYLTCMSVISGTGYITQFI